MGLWSAVVALVFCVPLFGSAVAPGSIVSIFGSNLASSSASAAAVPLPLALVGTSVTFDGVPVPLYYVSPSQVNAQAPAKVSSSAAVVVTTFRGASEPVRVEIERQGIGLFTQGGGGCGQGAVLNVHRDFSVSLNTPQNSFDPSAHAGLYAFGTGLGPVEPPLEDGEPTGPDPYAGRAIWGGTAVVGALSMWTPFFGRAPGFVGLDQYNVLLFAPFEGCGIPLRIVGPYSTSQPVAISVRRGGGACLPPPEPDSLGLLRRVWAFSSGIDPAPPPRSFEADFSASVGKQAPPLVNFQVNTRRFGSTSPPRVPGPFCPGFERFDGIKLDAGTLEVEGGRIVGRGGKDVGPFESAIEIPPPIELASDIPPGTILPFNQPVSVTWAQGPPDAVARLRLIAKLASGGTAFAECLAPASTGRLTIGTLSTGTRRGTQQLPVGPSEDVEVMLTIGSEGLPQNTFTASGLTLGGRHDWVYVYRFGGLKIR